MSKFWLYNPLNLFDRNHKYNKVKINNSYPEYIRKNKKIFKDFII